MDGEALLADDQVPPLDSDLTPGTVVGEYRIEGKLGEGGFGAVYRAVHPVIGKAAAIKVLGFDFSSNPEMVSRFVAEARAVNQIRHKNIIDVFSFGRLPDGRQYYVMELLEGTTLDRYLKERGCLSIDETMPVLRGIARALGAAHAGGIAHRDLKPENVFLVFDEDGGVLPKLIDFGIAKLLGDDGAAGHKTRTGTPMGTPYYMSPEQCRGKNVDHRTDIYSLGVLIHVLLTGKKPFDGESMMDILLKHITDPAPRLSAALPGAPKEMDDALAALLEKDPARRPQSAGEALALFEAAVKGLPPEMRSARAGRTPNGDRVSIGVGAMSAAEAETAHTVATGPSLGGGQSGSLAGEQNGTLTPASRDAGRTAGAGTEAPPKRRGWVPLAAIGAAVAGAAAAFLVIGAGGSKGAAAGSGTSAPSAETASLRSSGPEVVPVGEAGGDVAIVIATTPKGAEIQRDGKKIGDGGAPIKLTRSKAIVTLTVKAPGHAPKTIDVTPDKDATIEVTLAPEPPSAPAGAGTGAPKSTGGGAVKPTGAPTTTKAATPHKGDANDLSF